MLQVAFFWGDRVVETLERLGGEQRGAFGGWWESYREGSLLVSSALEEDLRRLELNRASREKGTLRYERNRYIV